MHRVAVIGASNMDLTAFPHAPVLPRDSNPGQIRTSMGGVGRNIAENMSRLGQRVSFVTAFGDDGFSQLMTDSLRQLCIDVDHCLYLRDTRGSMYICINDEHGDMLVAVNDMELYARLTGEFLREQADFLRTQEALVVDANLTEDALSGLAGVALPPLFADTVSAHKAPRLRALLPHLTGIKTNGLEAQCLTGVEVNDRQSALRAIRALHETGPRWVWLTLGAQGAMVSDGRRVVYGKPGKAQPVNTTGCGDAFMAGAVVAWLDCATPKNVLQYGLSNAACCARSSLAVSLETSEEAIVAGLAEFETEVIA